MYRMPSSVSPAVLVVAGVVLAMLLGAPKARAAEPLRSARPGYDGCRTCHTDIKRQLKRANGHAPFRTGQCGACHNPHAAQHKGLVTRDVGELCRGCHKGAQDAMGNVHAPFAGGDCLSCHDPHATNSKRLLKAEGADLCFGCHKREGGFDAKYGHTPARTGKCLSCHAPHASNQAALLRKDPARQCASCHPVSSGGPGHGGRDVTGSDCMSCHNPHGSDRKALVRATLHGPYGDRDCGACHGKGQGVAACLSCHEDVAGRFAASTSHVGRGTYCLSCHSPHASDQEHMLRAGQRRVCLSCHEDTARRMARDSSEKRHPLVDEGKCSACHQPHGADGRFMIDGDGLTTCRGCHERQKTFTHPVGPSVTDPRSKGDVTCVTCHGLMGSKNEYVLRYDRRKELCIQCHKGY